MSTEASSHSENEAVEENLFISKKKSKRGSTKNTRQYIIDWQEHDCLWLCLWDVTNPTYSSRDVKDKALKVLLSEKYECTKDDVSLRIKLF